MLLNNHGKKQTGHCPLYNSFNFQNPPPVLAMICKSDESGPSPTEVKARTLM